MELMFNWKGIPQRSKGLTFDDVLLVPQKSDVRSRRHPQLSSQLTRKYQIDIPIVSANMDTITEADMALAMAQLGGVGIIHRFLSPHEQVQEVLKVQASGTKIIAASVGVGEESLERAALLVNSGVNLITIDIAHGHSLQMLEMVSSIREKFPEVQIIAGNIATPAAAEDLILAGADAVKVGIGPGSMCTTRIITGCGVPQLTAIALCAEVTKKHGVPLIADGGLRTSGDLVKALAAGADCVMLGSLLSGTIETPGEIKNGRKQYRGMASKSAQVSWRGGVPEGMAPEGESTFVTVKGHVKDVIQELCGGIRSGMSYLNANTVSEMCQKAAFMEMTAAGSLESRAHGLHK